MDRLQLTTAGSSSRTLTAKCELVSSRHRVARCRPAVAGPRVAVRCQLATTTRRVVKTADKSLTCTWALPNPRGQWRLCRRRRRSLHRHHGRETSSGSGKEEGPFPWARPQNPLPSGQEQPLPPGEGATLSGGPRDEEGPAPSGENPPPLLGAPREAEPGPAPVPRAGEEDVRAGQSAHGEPPGAQAGAQRVDGVRGGGAGHREAPRLHAPSPHHLLRGRRRRGWSGQAAAAYIRMYFKLCQCVRVYVISVKCIMRSRVRASPRMYIHKRAQPYVCVCVYI